MQPVPEPQYLAARQFMEHKGYGDARPVEVERLEDVPCWYFYYQLPDGDLELEVWWDEKRFDWITTVTAFSPTGVAVGR